MSLISLKQQQELQGISTLALMGSVAAGKTSICKFLTGETTQKHSAELVNGCTIKMGYKNLKIYYNGHNFLTNPKTIPLGYNLVRHFSIADNPGHNSFMATLVTGISSIDNAIFLVSGTNGIEPQTRQHMKCFKSTEISNLTVVISKVDLVPTEQKLQGIINEIDHFMESESLSDEIDPPIIPMSAVSKINTEYLTKYLVSQPYPRNIESLIKKDFNMTIVRSFDINKPGTSIDAMEGAIFGGSIQGGYLAIGDTICILPGHVSFQQGKIVYTPLVTQVVGLRSDTAEMEVALPGGFIAIKTTLDSYYGKADKMVGNVIVKIESKDDIEKASKVVNHISVSNLVKMTEQDLIIGNEYLVVVHASGQMATLDSSDDEIYNFHLTHPIATFENEKVAILSKTGITIEMLSYGLISDSFVDDTIELIYQDDLDEFLVERIEKKVQSIELVNDLNEFPEFESYLEQLYDQESMIQNITFDKKKFTVNCPNIFLEKDTTSVSIKHADEIFKQFTEDPSISVQICSDFATFIISSYGDVMRGASPLVTQQQITFHNVKRANRKFVTNDFNKILDQFVTDRFTCKTCKTIGSMFLEKKKHYCKACTAVSMIKSTKHVEVTTTVVDDSKIDI